MCSTMIQYKQNFIHLRYFLPKTYQSPAFSTPLSAMTIIMITSIPYPNTITRPKGDRNYMLITTI